MCGKFEAMASWDGVTDLCQIADAEAAAGENDYAIAFRVMGDVRVIVAEAGERRVMPMRWSFPHPADWRRPQPIHARAETIDTMPAFAGAFAAGQRGIVLAKNFNEAPDSGEQHVVTPGDATAIGIAVLWRRFVLAGQPLPLFACVMVTVPANELLRGLPTDRMPAILAAEDWATWLGESGATPAEAKACLKTVQGVNWRMSPQQRARQKRRKPTMSDPGGLF